MIVAVVMEVYPIANWYEKNLRGSNRIRTHGLCISTAVLYQLSYEDPPKELLWVSQGTWRQIPCKTIRVLIQESGGGGFEGGRFFMESG